MSASLLRRSCRLSNDWFCHEPALTRSRPACSCPLASFGGLSITNYSTTWADRRAAVQVLGLAGAGHSNSHRPILAKSLSSALILSTEVAISPRGLYAVENAFISTSQPRRCATPTRGIKSRSPEAITKTIGLDVEQMISVPWPRAPCRLPFLCDQAHDRAPSPRSPAALRPPTRCRSLGDETLRESLPR